MTVERRPTDDLRGAPALATLPALSACIDAFTSALHIVHPDLTSRNPMSERESAAALLHMHLYACQELLRVYDHLTFDVCSYSDPVDDEPDDDIPF
jgi:hypothetical protein